MANTPLIRFSSVADPAPATALATPAFAVLPSASGTQIQLKSSSTTSNVFMPNGASAGATNSSYWLEGTFAGQLTRDPTIDLAFQSLLMNAYASKVLTPGSVEKPLTYEKMFAEGGTNYFRHARGCQHTSLSLDWDAEGNVDFSSDFIGLVDSRVTTAITGATYANPTAGKLLTGNDVSVTIGGLTTNQLKSGSVTIEMGRSVQSVCGSLYGVGIGFGGARTVSYEFSFYRRDYTFEQALVGNVTVPVEVNFGTAGNGYKFTSAKVSFEAPQDADDDSGQLVTITGTAGWDAAAAADVKITQL